MHASRFCLCVASFCLISAFPCIASVTLPIDQPSAPQKALHYRDYFYVGGTYTTVGNATVSDGSMYVERLTPPKVTAPYPLVFIHGRGMTGTNFLNTPDGRPGWADYFLNKGYEVFLVDQPARGRSIWQATLDGDQAVFDIYTIEARFTATQLYDLWPKAKLHTQWPGNGSVGDPTFDEFYASILPSVSSEVGPATRIRNAGAALLDKIGRAIILTHSQSGQYGWILADARPDKVVAIVALEPVGPPFINALFAPTPARAYGLTDIAVLYDPPTTSADDIERVIVSSDSSTNFTCIQQASPARKMVNLQKIPVLLVTSESGYHSVYDDCTVTFLRQAGVSVDHIDLGEVGIHGNGHMMFMEKNNYEIADRVVYKWLSESGY